MSYPPPPTTSTLRVFRPLVVIVLIALVGVGIVTAATWLGRRVGANFAPAGDAAVVEVEPGQDVEVEIPPGSSASQIGEILAQAGVVRSSTQFEAAVRTAGLAGSLKAGTYEMVTGMGPDQAIALLVRGPVARVYEVTVVEGLRVTEILDVLAEASGRPRAEFEQALTTAAVTTNLREMPAEPTLRHWEGLLFPDTYEFSEGATAAEILQRLAQTMEQRVGSIDWSAFEEAGFTRYDGIIIASLIESEVRVDRERPLVSSVIRNRLREGMLLEIDATILYALDTHDPAQIDTSLDSPYNTYQVDGLPPTPISAPGRAALEAAAAPAETDFFFYVLSAPDGSHTFSRTFEEHQAAVAKAREEGIIP